MSVDTDLAQLLVQVTAFVSRQTPAVDGLNDFFGGTVDDPASFNSLGGKTGALGYYPWVLADGTVQYNPCLARVIANLGSGGGSTPAPVFTTQPSISVS